jgi:hypothetical protein
MAMTTRSKARQAARDARNRVPLSEETVISEGGSPIQFGTISSQSDESMLTPIPETSGEGSITVEEGSFPSDNAPSEHGTIRAMSEEPEQSYTTAPGSFGISANPTGFSTPAVSAPRAQINEQLPSEEWERLRNDMRHLSVLTTQDKEESIENQRDISRFDEELRTLRTRVTNSYFRTSHVEETLQGIQLMIDRLDTRRDDVAVQSPRTAAVQTVFADRGPDEGSADYERRRSAQIRFEDQGFEEVEDPTSSSRERYKAKMAESRFRAAWKRPRGARTSGPSAQLISKGEVASDSEEHDGQHHETAETGDPQFIFNLDPGPQETAQPRYNYSINGGTQNAQSNIRTIRGPDLISARSSAQTGSARNMLDQDYARRSMSGQPRQLAGPYMAPATISGQHGVIQSANPQGLDDSDHETRMIDGLIEHIRESLRGIPDNLPEIKGLRAKLPEPYEGEDDFDRLDKWLQGMLRYYKLQRLTAMDKDKDRVLIAGSNLKGKAERWFCHEVERSTRIVRDWTFESVAIGLFRAFVTTATAQQAMQSYMRVRFSTDEGVMAFYRELMMLAGRLAQYPDPYSFRRRLLNGMPEDYRRYLALYKGVSAEHSSIDDIVQNARTYEKTIASWRSGRTTDRRPDHRSSTPTSSGQHRSFGMRDKLRSRNAPQRPPTGRSSAQGPKPTIGERANATATKPPAPKGDTSRLTCYRCGKSGHIASDTKCPQYKKPEQRQLFAAQVIDDRSESERPDQEGHQSDELQDEHSHEEASEEEADQPSNASPDGNLGGSQYDEEQSSYEEFDGYEPRTDDDEPIYIRAMITDGDANMSSAPALFDDVDWQPRRDALKRLYQRAPCLPGDDWEFTPRNGITHLRGCQQCANQKEHVLVGQMLREERGSSAWKTQERFEKDLIQIGWTLAIEAGRSGQGAAAAIESLEQRNYYLQTHAECMTRLRDKAIEQCEELREELACERLDVELRGGEADFWLRQFDDAQKAHSDLQQYLIDNCICMTPTSRLRDDDMRPMATENVYTDRALRLEGSVMASVGHTHRDEPVARQLEENTTHDLHVEVMRLAAARDDVNTSREREFRAAQSHKCEPGTRPLTLGKDRRCMAVLINVHGLEAYALLDTGSTTLSVTHDFARVAKLNVSQLENPVLLQLGTIGSRSMINFGTRARLELGPIIENDAYLDVVNLDRYDMIIGTPFMRKHGLVLDFKRNVLRVQDTIITMLTAGQEDLMLANRRVTHARTFTKAVVRPAQATH